VKKYFTNEFIENKNYKQGDTKKGLYETFFKMDEILREPKGQQELKQEAKLSKEDDEKNNKQTDKPSQIDMYRQLLDPRNKEDCDISMYTGCTACTCVIDDNKMYFANAGDSRVVLCRNGVAYPMSNDHKPELDSEKTRIYKADGWVTEGRIKGNCFSHKET
jgi:protein phosphatase 1G